jgi:hypothetical protein
MKKKKLNPQKKPRMISWKLKKRILWFVDSIITRCIIYLKDHPFAHEVILDSGVIPEKPLKNVYDLVSQVSVKIPVISNGFDLSPLDLLEWKVKSICYRETFELTLLSREDPIIYGLSTNRRRRTSLNEWYLKKGQCWMRMITKSSVEDLVMMATTSWVHAKVIDTGSLINSW